MPKNLGDCPDIAAEGVQTSTAQTSSTRYFVALLPPVTIQTYATEVIQELAQHYCSRTSKAPPHITLQPPFCWSPSWVSSLRDQIDRFVSSQPTVPIFLSGFGAFAPRVLYINVVKTPGLLSLQAALQQSLEAIQIVDATRSFTPHLTVASRNLTRQTFRQAWAELEQRSVKFEFTAERLTLLVHDGQFWQIDSEYPLRG